MPEDQDAGDDIVLPEGDAELIEFTERLLSLAKEVGISDEELATARQHHEQFVEACEELEAAERRAEAAEASMREAGMRLMEASAKLRQHGAPVPGDPILPN